LRRCSPKNNVDVYQQWSNGSPTLLLADLTADKPMLDARGFGEREAEDLLDFNDSKKREKL
jgi:hypothetical protein